MHVIGQRSARIAIETMRLWPHLAHTMSVLHTKFQIGARPGSHPPGERERFGLGAGRSLISRAPSGEGWRGQFFVPVRSSRP